MNFLHIHYLKNGTRKQAEAFEVLTNTNILQSIAEFDPILVGTIPINIAIEGSDLDIICHWKDKQDFVHKLQLYFSNEKNFTIREAIVNKTETVIANFRTGPFEIELFGQDVPSQHQNGYRHMLIEYEILKAKGENFRLEVIRLKEQGYKTEPAFCKLLGLTGNPYEALLKYTP